MESEGSSKIIMWLQLDFTNLPPYILSFCQISGVHTMPGHIPPAPSCPGTPPCARRSCFPRSVSFSCCSHPAQPGMHCPFFPACLVLTLLSAPQPMHTPRLIHPSPTPRLSSPSDLCFLYDARHFALNLILFCLVS